MHSISLTLWTVLIASMLAVAPVNVARAVEPSEMLADPALEARARDLSKGLRCVVCRNQNIDDSHAGVAKDLRIALRERIQAGDSDEQAVQFLVDRFGAYILLKPPFRPTTYLLWLGPLMLLLLAAAGFRRIWKTAPASMAPQDALSEEDQAIIAKILQQKDE